MCHGTPNRSPNLKITSALAKFFLDHHGVHFEIIKWPRLPAANEVGMTAAATFDIRHRRARRNFGEGRSDEN